MTKDGTDPLLLKEENIQTIVEPPTAKEINHAITHNIGKLVSVVSKLDLCSAPNTDIPTDKSMQQVQEAARERDVKGRTEESLRR